VKRSLPAIDPGMPSVISEIGVVLVERVNWSLTRVRPQLVLVIVLECVKLQVLAVQDTCAETGPGSCVDNNASSRSESTSAFICGNHCAP